MLIKKLSIRNFKGIESLDLDNLEQINQICGQNAVGKTSLNESIKFLFSGNGKDKNKIKDGENQAIVSALIENNGQEINLKKTVSTDGTLKTEIKIDGKILKKSEKNLIKELFGVGSFDPQKIVSKEERVKVFEGLIDQPFIYPKELKQIKNAELSSFEKLKDQNPISALLKIQDELKQHRLFVGRTKHLHESVLKNSENEQEELYKEIKELSSGIEEKGEKLQTTKDLEKIKIQWELKTKEVKNIDQNLTDNKKSLEDLRTKKSVCENEITSLQKESELFKVSHDELKEEEIADLQTLKNKEDSLKDLELKSKILLEQLRIETEAFKSFKQKTEELTDKKTKTNNSFVCAEDASHQQQKSLSNYSGQIKQLEKNIDDLQSKKIETITPPKNLEQKIILAKRRDKLTEIHNKVFLNTEIAKKHETEYTELNRYISKDFPLNFQKYIDPIKKMVKGIGFENGDWLYNNKNVDSLSSSETVDLALKLIQVRSKKSNVVCIDNAEIFDNENIKNVSFDNSETVFFLFKVGEKFENLKSSINVLKKKEK